MRRRGACRTRERHATTFVLQPAGNGSVSTARSFRRRRARVCDSHAVDRSGVGTEVGVFERLTAPEVAPEVARGG
jgi:hypothetical protein